MHTWEPVYSMGYGVIHFSGGGTAFFQGDDFTNLDDEIENAPTLKAEQSILDQYWEVAQ